MTVYHVTISIGNESWLGYLHIYVHCDFFALNSLSLTPFCHLVTTKALSQTRLFPSSLAL